MPYDKPLSVQCVTTLKVSHMTGELFTFKKNIPWKIIIRMEETLFFPTG